MIIEALWSGTFVTDGASPVRQGRPPRLGDGRNIGQDSSWPRLPAESNGHFLGNGPLQRQLSGPAADLPAGREREENDG